MADYEVVSNLDPKSRYGFAVNLGGGHSLVAKIPSPFEAGAPPPNVHRPAPAYQGRNIAQTAPVQSAPTEPTVEISLFSLPVYPWMLLLGVLAYLGVSAKATFFPQGLHLHPIYGAAAFLATIWLYRQMMVFLPTAILLAIPSAAISGVLAWSISDAASFRHYGMSLQGKVLSLGLLWHSLPAFLPTLNKWIIAAIVGSLAAHGSYWCDRRAMARTRGWVFSRSPLVTAKELFTLASLACLIGWMISLRG